MKPIGKNRLVVLLGLAMFFSFGIALVPAQAPAGKNEQKPNSYQVLQAEIKACSNRGGGDKEIKQLLRNWFVQRDKAHQLALQQYIRRGEDQRCLEFLLEFLVFDLGGILGNGGPKNESDKLFKSYLPALVELKRRSKGKVSKLCLAALATFPGSLRVELFGKILADPKNRLFTDVMILAPEFHDLKIAPYLAPYIETGEHVAIARAALRRLSFISFTKKDTFQKWWEQAKQLTWQKVRDSYLKRCMQRDANFAGEKKKYAKEVVKETEDFFLPLIEDLVRCRIKGSHWTQPLALLRQERTIGVVLKGLLAVKPDFSRLPAGEEKNFLAFLDRLLDLAELSGDQANGPILQALSFFSQLPTEAARQRSRALTCLAGKARSGKAGKRRIALDMIGTYSGIEADQILLSLFCSEKKAEPVLARVVAILKTRDLHPGGVAPLLKKVQARLTELFSQTGFSADLRLNAICSISHWPPAESIPFLERILLARNLPGVKVEEREEAAVGLQNILKRHKDQAVLKLVAQSLIKGLRVKGKGSGRIRTLCAAGLDNKKLIVIPGLPNQLVDGLGGCLAVEKDAEAANAMIQSLLCLGDGVAKVADKVRFQLLFRLKQGSKGKEAERLCRALMKLCDKPAAKLEAGQGFAGIGDRKHALPFFFDLLKLQRQKPDLHGLFGADKKKAAWKTALFLRDCLAVILSGKLADQYVPGSNPLQLSAAELKESHVLVQALTACRARGELPVWGRRENEWSAWVYWQYAILMQQGGKQDAGLFLAAVKPMKVLLTLSELSPNDKIDLRVKITNAYFAANQHGAAEATITALVKDAPLRGYPLRAQLMEQLKRWFEAAASWRRAAIEHPANSLDQWQARLKEINCFCQAGRNAEARRTLSGYQSGAKPVGKGAAWDQVRSQLKVLEQKLPQARVKEKPKSNGEKGK